MTAVVGGFSEALWGTSLLRRITCRKCPYLTKTTPTRNYSVQHRMSKLRRCTISTVHPARLTSSDYHDLSGAVEAHFMQQGQLVARLPYIQKNKGFIPFPDGTRGFLYYQPHVPKHMAGAIRFRVTDSADAVGFCEGRDLVRPRGDPWGLPILSICRNVTTAGLRDILLRDGFLDRQTLQNIADFKLDRAFTRYNVVPSLGHEFYVDFAKTCFSIQAVGDEVIQPYNTRVLGDVSIKGSPYTGFAVCCFERAGPHEPRGLVLRVLRILEPVTCVVDGYQGLPMPVEGDLVRMKDGSPRIWNLDKPYNKPLQLL
ncbi:hypothetical protein PLICRDRAFT_37749 [Plicaturopsis crispa FD-325 SS-3]|nr:hypothetical protein PLICRDRAFT_37749 [Plicaturopsis crispa FD-325 SS-3]